MADIPLDESVKANPQNYRQKLEVEQNVSPMIGGQLIIYDIDEEPPKSSLKRSDNGLFFFGKKWFMIKFAVW